MSIESSPGTMVVLIPAYNEAESIGATIESVLAQARPADKVVVIPNGCTDDTADVARSYPVTVMELPRLPHGKSQALNTAWQAHGRQAGIVVCLDADTVLPPNALADWETELTTIPSLGGTSSKFTMIQPGILPRLQKLEFAAWTRTALMKGYTTVLAGTGCAIRGAALRQVEAIWGGPWAYDSATEDFKLTLHIRRLGYYCHVSPTVRAYTDSMSDLKSLWNQRVKWQVGTIQDLLDAGWTPLTRRDWVLQGMNLFNLAAKTLWATFMILLFAFGLFKFLIFWWLFPLAFVFLDYARSKDVPHRTWKDGALALSFFPNEAFQWLRAAWVAKSWWIVLTKNKTDLWSKQYTAEGVHNLIESR